MSDWITPTEAAGLLGVSLEAVYTYACRFDWDTRQLGPNPKQGVLYWADDVREELPNHGREPSEWDAWADDFR